MERITAVARPGRTTTDPIVDERCRAVALPARDLGLREHTQRRWLRLGSMPAAEHARRTDGQDRETRPHCSLSVDCVDKSATMRCAPAMAWLARFARFDQAAGSRRCES